MTWIKRIFDFYLNASIHVALAVLSLVLVSGLIFNITVPKSLFLLIFFGVISCYNFVKYGVEAKKYILLTNVYHKNIQFFSLGCLVVALCQIFFLPKNVFIGLAVLAVLTGLYAIPVLPKYRNFRSLSGLKILIVAIVWAGTTVILPWFINTAHITWDVWVEAIQRLFLVLVLMVPFEIRDLKYDDAALKTLPQRIGSKNTKIIAIIWIAIFYGLTFFKNTYDQPELWSKFILSIILFVNILFTTEKQKKYFASFWVEAIPILWYVIVILFRYYLRIDF